MPVDIVGGSVFPPVGQLSYLLTLPPYAFYWFLLAEGRAIAEPGTRRSPNRCRSSPPSCCATSDLEEVQPGYGRQVLEREALPQYLPKRRWFASKGEKLTGVKIAYAVRLPGTPATASSMMAEIEVSLAGRTERYVLPLGIVWEDEATGNLPAQLALTRVRRGPGSAT